MMQVELSKYDKREQSSYSDRTFESPDLGKNVHLGEESQMEGIALEMTSTFTFVQGEKVEIIEEVEEKPFRYSGLQIFAMTCYISSFIIAMIGIMFLYLQR